MLDTEIRKALTSGVGTHQGETLTVPRALVPVMRDMGLIGEHNGLTRQGSILAARLRREAEEAMFA